MRKRQSPETKVRSGVRDGSENELNGLDHGVNEDLAESVVAFILAHIFELLIKRSHFLLSLSNEIFTIVTVTLDIHATLEWLLHLVLVVEVGELDHVVVLWLVLLAESEAWLGAEHDWNTDSNGHEKSYGDSIHLSDAISNKWLLILSLLFIICTETEHGGDHDLDDGWNILIFMFTWAVDL